MRLPRVLWLVLLLGIAALEPGAQDAQGRSGAGGFTIDELVVRALADNQELRAVRVEVDAARGRLRQAALRPNPMLDLSGQQSVTGPDNNITVGVTLPLDLNRRKEGRVGVAERELEMKAAQVAERERQLRAEVRMKAREVLAARRNLRITEELLDINRHALGLIRERVRRGAAPSLEENLQLVEINRFEASRQILESRVEVPTLQLKVLAGLDPDAPLSLRDDLHPMPVRLNRETGLARALVARPDLMVARAEVAMAGAKIRKEEAEGRWDASVNVGYMRQNFGYDLNGLTMNGEPRAITDIFHYVGGGVTVMLPLRNRNQGNIAAAFAEGQATERRQEFVALTIRQEVAAAFTQHEAAQRSLEIYAQGVRDVARQNLEVIRKAYTLGRTSLLDVITEQRRYIDIEMGYTESLKQVYDALVDIERAANPGQVVAMGEALFVVTDLSEVWAVGDLYEQDFPHVRVGSDATLTTLAYPGLRLRGRVTYIDPRVDPQARTAKVRVEVSNPEGRLRLGMYVTMTFSTSSRERAVVVPRAAVQTIGGRRVVFIAVPDEAGKFVQRTVKLGPLAGESYTVLSGLEPGEVVATEGSFFLRAESLRLVPSG